MEQGYQAPGFDVVLPFLLFLSLRLPTYLIKDPTAAERVVVPGRERRIYRPILVAGG
jgi:hypothetical protein